ncbi:hypothetical protein [Niabella agricola]|nr:hypothetical protein [Niabella agricola]
MKTKAFSTVTALSTVITLSAALLSVIGIAFTGLYPGILVLLFVTLIPIASRFFAKKINGRPHHFQQHYYTSLTVVNLLLILVVVWMAFVIVHDRVLHDCC